MADLQKKLTIFGLMLLLAHNAIGQNRGISIDIRETPSIDAPVAETVELYQESYALVIGIDDYNNGWPRLSNAVKDAEIVSEELRNQGFEVELHKNLNSEQLATTFKRFFTIRGQNPSARLFVWFAGHGMTLDGEGYLVPADAPVPSDSASVGNFKFSAYFLRDFGGLMRAAKSKHAYAVFDACFAGTVFASARALPPPAITRATTKPVRQFLTSGDANQEVSDDGTFRELFVRAIRGDERADANGDGYVTASELGMYLNDRVTNLTEEAQTPRYGKLRDKNFDLGDFVFVLPGTTPSGEPGAPRVARAAPDPEIIFWNSIQNSESVDEFDAYLAQYPEGRFAELASARKRAILRKQIEEKREEDAQRDFEVSAADLDMKASSTANVRARPFPSARRVGQLPEDATVWVVGETRTPGGLWYQVARDGAILGFVYSPLLETVTSVAEYLPIDKLPLPGAETMVAAAAAVAATEAEEIAEASEPTIDDEFSMLVDDLLEESFVQQEDVARTEEAAKEARRQTRSIPVPTESGSLNGEMASRETTESPAEPANDPTTSQDALLAETDVTSPPQNDTLITAEASDDQPMSRGVAATTDSSDLSVAPSQAAAAGSAADPVSEEASAGEAVAVETVSADTAGGAAGEPVSEEVITEEIIAEEADAEPAVTENAVVEATNRDDVAGELAALEDSTAAESSADETVAPIETETIDQPAEFASVQVASVEVAAAEATETEPAGQSDEAAAAAASETIQAQTPAPEPTLELALADVETVKQEVPPGLKRFIVAALAGDSKVQASLGYMYETGTNGVSVDKMEAVRWYRMASENGEAGAMFNLALLYEAGEGVGGIDMTEAAFWYRRAADSGDIDAQQRLGFMYEVGQGVMKDAAEALFWYRKAGLAGSPDAQQKLGYMYENGEGVEADPLEAARWYEKAALAGRQTAQNNLARLYQLGVGVEKDLDRARYWYEKSAAQGNETANKNLANLDGS